ATNVRHPRDFRGDLAAMIGSAHLGEQRFLALANEFGWETSWAGIEAVLDGAERQTRAVIAEWRDGVYHGEALLDDDGRGGQDIIEAIIKALAPACPERAMAGWGRRFRIAIQGKDPRAPGPDGRPGGKPFIWHFFQARPGGGASAAGDGWPGGGEWQAAGGI